MNFRCSNDRSQRFCLFTANVSCSWIVGGLRGCTNSFGNVHAQQRLFLLCFGASPTRSASPRAGRCGVLLLVTPWAALSAIMGVVSFPNLVEQSFQRRQQSTMCVCRLSLSLYPLSLTHQLKPNPCCWRACVCGHRPAAASGHWATGAQQWIGRRVSYWVSRLGRLQARSRQCSQRLISNSFRIFNVARSSG